MFWWEIWVYYKHNINKVTYWHWPMVVKRSRALILWRSSHAQGGGFKWEQSSKNSSRNSHRTSIFGKGSPWPSGLACRDGSTTWIRGSRVQITTRVWSQLFEKGNNKLCPNFSDLKKKARVKFPSWIID